MVNGLALEPWRPWWKLWKSEVFRKPNVFSEITSLIFTLVFTAVILTDFMHWPLFGILWYCYIFRGYSKTNDMKWFKGAIHTSNLLWIFFVWWKHKISFKNAIYNLANNYLFNRNRNTSNRNTRKEWGICTKLTTDVVLVFYC